MMKRASATAFPVLIVLLLLQYFAPASTVIIRTETLSTSTGKSLQEAKCLFQCTIRKK